MIEKLTLENFQSHKNSILEFDKGMNVIIGQSDSGKTAIIRALKWVTTNKPGGDDFRSNWGGDTIVCMATPTNTIVRAKTSKENSYKLDSLEFKAFGQDVPVEIQNALNMSEVNLQQQLDSPFLLSDTAGAVASHFNKMAKLDKIDRATSFVNSEITKLKQSINTSQSIIDSKETELKSFVDLAAFERKLVRIEKWETFLKALQETKANLIYTISRLERIESLKIRYESTISIEEKIVETLALYEKKNVLTDKFLTLKKLSITIFNKQTSIEKAEKVLEIESDLNKCLNMYVEHEETVKFSKEIRRLTISIENNLSSQKTTLKLVSDLEIEFKENFPDVCPLCETEIKHTHGKN